MIFIYKIEKKNRESNKILGEKTKIKVLKRGKKKNQSIKEFSILPFSFGLYTIVIENFAKQISHIALRPTTFLQISSHIISTDKG